MRCRLHHHRVMRSCSSSTPPTPHPSSTSAVPWSRCGSVERLQFACLSLCAQQAGRACFASLVQVPDGVGVAVVAQVRSAATLAATSSGDAAGAAATSDRTGSGGGGNREGLDALASICSAAPAVTIPKAYSLTGDTADETTVGLSLELFRMRLTSPPHASEELARYLAHIAVDCTANEPQTQTRRSAVVWARRQRQLLVAGTVVALAGVAVAAYTYHRGTRTTVDSLIARARSAVSGWFSRGSVAGAAAGGGSQRK